MLILFYNKNRTIKIKFDYGQFFSIQASLSVTVGLLSIPLPVLRKTTVEAVCVKFKLE
jgi:hypothetical protein